VIERFVVLDNEFDIIKQEGGSYPGVTNKCKNEHLFDIITARYE
jgi:hypothetical protein